MSEIAGSKTRTAKAGAMEFLQTALAGAPVPAAELSRIAREHGLTAKAIRSAREALGVEIERNGFGRGAQSVWSLHRTERTGGLLKRMGLQRGMLDFLLISPAGGHRWLELKRGSAPLTEAQRAFTDELTERAVPWAVCRDYESAVRQLRAWGALK
jgi:hypothetical protein